MTKEARSLIFGAWKAALVKSLICKAHPYRFSLVVLSWLWFVAIPMVNATHHDSHQWMRLCTSAGIVLIAVIDEGHSPVTQAEHDNQCPCVHCFADLIGAPGLAVAPGKTPAPNNSTQTSLLSQWKPYFQARAPPTDPPVPSTPGV